VESHSAALLFIKPYFIHYKFTFLIFFFFSITTGFSQKLFEKKYKTGHVYSFLRDQGNHESVQSGSSNVVPLVFHIISNNPASITDQQIIDAVQDLNNAFAHAGSYAESQGVNTGITFCLAKIDPDGGISSGITRTQSVLTDFDQELEDSLVKKLVSWNSKQYCNIWLVDSVRNEYYTTFGCGAWDRKINRTYASFLPDGSYLDGIVTTGFGPPLAGLMGSYLGLMPTFVFGSCANNNCDTDGDGICDTPPSSRLATSCTGYQNSCTSDTLSGYKVDMQDPISNFMSFTGYCTNSFTAGQAAKMRSTLSGVRNSLLMQNKCNPPCSENISASFTRDNWLPVPGDQIHFTATSSGGTNYQWMADGVAVGTNSPTLTQSFSQKGAHQVSLKVYNANPGCFAGYSDDVLVSCGVLARFTPDKRIIASKVNIMLDTIYFENRSVNATSYQWWISNDTALAPQIVGTSFDLHQTFKTPGQYTIWLVASNGGCSDTTQKMKFTVNDPTIDATIGFRDVQCYQQTKIIVIMTVCNHGYVSIPAGTPVTFYDGDPNSGNAKKLGPVFEMQDPIAGNCCYNFTTILDIGKPGLNQLYAVVNDNGTTNPLVLPNNPLPETYYTDNIAYAANFQFRAKIDPPSATMEPGDTLQFSGSGSPGQVSSYLWNGSPGLSCTDCASPVFIAGKTNATEKLIVTSSYSCVDSAVSTILVPYADDYVVQIDSMECSKDDSARIAFTVCNQFKRGIIPNGLRVSFYFGDPSTDTAHLLQPGYSIVSDNQKKCISFTSSVASVEPGSIFAVVNDSLVQPPVQLPADSLFPEKDYTNNITQFNYELGQISVQPADTTVHLNQLFQVTISSVIYDPASTLWDPGPGYSLSCTNCQSPLVSANSDGILTVHTNNQYGCRLSGKAEIHVIPPDFTTQILGTNCYTNDSLLVKFKICANNDYDILAAGIPVSFYDGNWGGQSKLLEPGFYTTKVSAGNCDSFSTVIKSPQSGSLSIVVNDKGADNSSSPDTALSETDFTNNSSTVPVVPFIVTVSPTDTTIGRLTPVSVHFEVAGGQLNMFKWNPSEFISCTTCTQTVITPPHSILYELEVQNEYSCTAKANIQINTFSSGRVNIPNAFSPNGDGRNDVFYIIGSQDIKIVKEFSVFNRWGQAVFRAENFPANDPGFGWNGMINGKTATAEAYVYIVIIEFKDGTTQVFKGSVVLVL
jgi:gliding motility-associated-like protein